MTKLLSMIIAATFAAVSVNAIAQDKGKGEAKKEMKKGEGKKHEGKKEMKKGEGKKADKK